MIKIRFNVRSIYFIFKPKPAPVDGDMRSSLMAAIRQAGGSGKLRSVSEKKMESKKKKQVKISIQISGTIFKCQIL